MLRRLFAVGLLGVVVGVIACGSDPGSEFGDGTSSSSSTSGSLVNTGDGGSLSSGGVLPDLPPIECNKMDIVFVIDNSQSMREEQRSLAASIPKFIEKIETYKTAAGELLDYRIGILSTDVKADKGAMRKSRGTDSETQTCNPLDNDKPWLERTDGTDAGPSVADVFGCRARLGITGDNVELPLESARLALYERLADGTNKFRRQESFIRPDALLAFIIITDEDEGGGNGDPTPPAPANPPEFYAARFDDLKGGYRARWATAVIAGEDVCRSNGLGEADQAVRLKQFVAAATNGVFDSICKDDFSGSLDKAFTLFANACKGFPGVK